MNLLILLLLIFVFTVCLKIGESAKLKIKFRVRPDLRNKKKIYRHVFDQQPSPVNEQVVINKQYFQDIFVEQSAPMKISFGHVFENPKQWEQRFESNDMENKRYQGKVIWGTQDGNYGEHYWDLNH